MWFTGTPYIYEDDIARPGFPIDRDAGAGGANSGADGCGRSSIGRADDGFGPGLKSD